MSATVHAQGIGTLYGIVDAGLGYTSNQRVATNGTVSWQASPTLRVAAGYDFTRGSPVGGQSAPK